MTTDAPPLWVGARDLVLRELSERLERGAVFRTRPTGGRRPRRRASPYLYLALTPATVHVFEVGAHPTGVRRRLGQWDRRDVMVLGDPSASFDVDLVAAGTRLALSIVGPEAEARRLLARLRSDAEA